MNITPLNLEQLSSQKKKENIVIFTHLKKSQIKTPSSFKSWAPVIQNLYKNKHYKSQANEVLFVPAMDGEGFENLILVGLGESFSHPEQTRSAAGALCRVIEKHNLSSVHVHLPSLNVPSPKQAEHLQAFTEGLILGDYNYKKYIKKSKSSVNIHVLTKGSSQKIKNAIADGCAMADSINFSRWLGDSPANKMTPDILAKETQKVFKGLPVKVTVWDEKRVKKERMGGLYAVGKGGAIPPCFIAIEYYGTRKSKKPVYFVGKGLCFDCGGISLKPPQKMDEMKYDMCGGANVIGTLLTLARQKAKVNAIAYVPASENLINGKANKPSDVITARNGKTVEILNTDAEGRLILMEALSYASEKKPAAIIDAATLTGAMLVALGNVHTGFYTRDMALRGKIEKAAKTTGEKVWAMPLTNEHVDDIKGTFSDIQNLGATGGAGSATAAAFLEQFVAKGIPWAHFDIAGTAWNCGNRLTYVPRKGATGSIIRTFVELAKSF